MARTPETIFDAHAAQGTSRDLRLLRPESVQVSWLLVQLVLWGHLVVQGRQESLLQLLDHQAHGPVLPILALRVLLRAQDTSIVTRGLPS